MDKKQLKSIIKEEYQNVKSFMEYKYGFTPELGKVISNPYAKSFVNEAKEPEVITTLRKIVKNKQNDLIKDTKSGKKVRVDMNSANLMVQVYDALKQQSNKDKFVKSGIVMMGHMAYKLMKKESVNECAYTIMNVNHTESTTKKKLMKKWKQKGGYENFGQKELDILKKKLKYNPYGSQEERQIARALDGFDNWSMNYTGNMRESINEAKVKRPVNRWLELKNDESMHPHKKMAMGLKELKYQLRETEKFFNWYNKIKTMNELDSNQYWKRTNSHIYKIKERLINIARTIQEIEKV
jgi:hypothetical protein